jgi:hypothetical protein
VAGRFRLYMDADIDGRLIHALRAAGWDMVRAIDLYPEGTDDSIHLARARLEGRVLAANDRDMKRHAEAALARNETLPGLIWWPRQLYARLSFKEFVASFERLAAEDDPFGNNPIRILSAR